MIVRNYLNNPVKYVFLALRQRSLLNWLPDIIFLKMMYRFSMGKKLNLKDPKTFNEKIQWLKLYDRREAYSEMVDKYLVKFYVEKIIGKEYIIPTYGVWDNFEEIDFDMLPNQFVLKCTHDSGGLVVCKNKDELNFAEARKKINRCLKTKYFYSGREWPYKNVKPRIIAEQYMEDCETGELRDYKFFCFNGCVKLLFVASDRQNKDVETKFDFFDAEFNHLDLKNGHPNSVNQIKKPVNFDLMKQLASQLSAGIPHLRVDFYEVNGKVYFGELTFSHWSGMVPFDPPQWDYKLGSYIELPCKNVESV